jgi:hypothetical protein
MAITGPHLILLHKMHELSKLPVTRPINIELAESQTKYHPAHTVNLNPFRPDK